MKRSRTLRQRILPAAIERRLKGQGREIRELVVDAFRAGKAHGAAEQDGRLLDYLDRRIEQQEREFGALTDEEVAALAASFDGADPEPRVFAHYSGAAAELIQMVVWLGQEEGQRP